jgi:hypothetical protein
MLSERERTQSCVYLFRRVGVMTSEEWNTYFNGQWYFNGAKQDKHLAMFPDELSARLIKMFSFPDETVLDPFACRVRFDRMPHAIQSHALCDSIACRHAIRSHAGVRFDRMPACDSIACRCAIRSHGACDSIAWGMRFDRMPACDRIACRFIGTTT